MAQRDYRELVYTLRQQFPVPKAQGRQGALPGVGFSADFGFYPFLSKSVVVLRRGSNERLLHQLQQY
jgi:hypothetical protein